MRLWPMIRQAIVRPSLNLSTLVLWTLWTALWTLILVLILGYVSSLDLPPALP